VTFEKAFLCNPERRTFKDYAVLPSNFDMVAR